MTEVSLLERKSKEGVLHIFSCIFWPGSLCGLWQHWQIPPIWRNNFRVSRESYDHHALGETSIVQGRGQTRQEQFNTLTIQRDTNGCWIKHGKDIKILSKPEVPTFPLLGVFPHNRTYIQVWNLPIKYRTLLMHKQFIVIGEHHLFLASPFQWKDFSLPEFLPWWKAQTLTAWAFLSGTGWLVQDSLPMSTIHTASK